MADWLIVHANGGRAADGTRVVSEHSLTELHTASAPSGYALGWDTDGPASAPTRLVHSSEVSASGHWASSRALSRPHPTPSDSNLGAPRARGRVEDRRVPGRRP
jgi:hypothetical protein